MISSTTIPTNPIKNPTLEEQDKHITKLYNLHYSKLASYLRTLSARYLQLNLLLC